MEWQGLLIVDKPRGLTSHDVVDRVRRALGCRRVGHTGTLDPEATGVLVLCLGKATRLQRFLVAHDKEYVARIRLGFATDTYDATGKPTTALVTSKQVSVEEIEKMIETFRGTIQQIPPMFSAKKREGRRLYRLARRGETVERHPISVTIHEIELLPTDGSRLVTHPDGTMDVTLRVKCSTGTYVRALAHELGERLGCGGHLVALRRTAVGPFRVDEALPLDVLERKAADGTVADCLIPLSRALPQMPELTVGDQEKRRLVHGRLLAITETVKNPCDSAYVRLVDRTGRLIAIGEIVPGEGLIRPRVVMDSAD